MDNNYPEESQAYFEQNQQETDQAEKIKRAFLAMMSHEIRTPMNGLIGMSALLAETRLTVQQRMYLETITVCAERLLKVMHDTLDFSQTASACAECKKEGFDPNSCIESTATHTGTGALAPPVTYNIPGIEAKRILLVVNDPHHRSMLKDQLIQWKLLVTEAGSGQEALEILSKDTPADLVITDNQMPDMDGIKLTQFIKKKYTRIPIILLDVDGNDCSNLQSFHSILIKPIRPQLLCKQVISALQQINSPTLPGKTLHEKLPYNFSEMYPLRILVAEDNQINQQVILHILNKMGYRPELVENGLEAVEASAMKRFDLILMDMQMPEMDGLQATKAIRKTIGKQPVIIALTANALEGDRQECLNAGMDDYISKPFKLEVLVSKLEKWSLHKMAV